MKKTIVWAVLICLMLALFAGCGTGAGSSGTVSEPKSSTSGTVSAPETGAPAEEPTDEPQDGEMTLPITEDEVTLSFWYFCRPAVESTLDNGMYDNYTFQAISEKTGIEFEFISASEPNAFSIMIAGGEYADLMVGAVNRYPAGADNAINDEVLLDLTDLLKENAPIYWDYINSDADIFRSATTNEGKVAAVYAFVDEVVSTNGPMVRQDWLDEIGMEAPTTYDGYYDMLTAFKTELNAESAMILPGFGAPRDGYLAGGFGVQAYATNIPSLVAPFYQENGVVKYGFAEEGFREYVTLMHKWYSEGLIFKDYYSYTKFNPEDDIVGQGQTGLVWADIGQLDSWNDMFGFNMVAMPDAVKKEGDVNHLGVSSETIKSEHNISISTQCEHPELAAKLMNFLFTDEGSFLCNYGVEGITYEMDGDTVKFTEMMTNDPTGLSLNKQIYKYAIDTQLPFFVQAKREWGAYSDASLATQGAWTQNRDGDWLLPLTMSKTAEESDRFNVVFADIMTYCTESLNKMIVGEMSVDDFDAFVKQQYDLGLQECLDIQQGAYDRYIAK